MSELRQSLVLSASHVDKTMFTGRTAFYHSSKETSRA